MTTTSRPSTWRHLCAPLATLTLLLAAAPVVLAADGEATVTIDAENTPLGDICADLARQVGREVRCTEAHVAAPADVQALLPGKLLTAPASSQRISLKLAGVPLVEALAALARKSSLVVVATAGGWALQTPAEAMALARAALGGGNVQEALARWQAVPGETRRYPALAATDPALPLDLGLALLSAGDVTAARAVWEGCGLLQERLDGLTEQASRIQEHGLRRREMLHALRRAQRLCMGTGASQDARSIAELVQALVAAPRKLRTLVAVDVSAAQDPQWQAKLFDRIQACSQALQAQAGISLEVTAWVSWIAPQVGLEQGAAGMTKLLESLARSFPAEQTRADLTVGFVCVPLAADDTMTPETVLFGLAPPQYRGYVIARDISYYGFVGGSGQAPGYPQQWGLSPAAVRRTLMHELCHALGALHVDDPQSVMRARAEDSDGLTLDAGNAAVLAAARWMDLPTGPVSLDDPELEALIAAYRAMEGKAAAGNGAELCQAECFLALGDLHAERGEIAASQAAYQRVSALRQRVSARIKIVGADGTDMLAVAEALAQRRLQALKPLQGQQLGLPMPP